MRYLLLDDTVEELLHHLVDAPDESLEGDAKFNTPSAACEVLCCEASLCLKGAQLQISPLCRQVS